MKCLQNITFLSDFGWGGGYVAACEATLARLSPHARVFHISHEVPVGDVAAGALVLARVAALYPHAAHLAVVDPGVGTARRALALATARGDLLVGPDNGLLVDAGKVLGGMDEGWALEADAVRGLAGLPSEDVSMTFHGRDLFAPASALLASGVEPAALGSPLDLTSLVRLSPPTVDRSQDGLSAPVVEVDRFGNVALDLGFEDIAALAEQQGHQDSRDSVPGGRGTFLVGVEGEGAPDWTARIVHTYGDLAAGELGLFKDSWGQAALALNGASAAEFLGVRRNERVTLTLVSRSPQGASE